MYIRIYIYIYLCVSRLFMLIEHIRKDRYQDAINRHKYIYINRHEQNFTLDVDSDKWKNKIFITLLDSFLALTNTCQD